MASPLLNVMSAAAVKAGKGLLRDFGEVDRLQVSRKGTSNFVTKTDLRTEKMLVEELGKARPGYSFLLEEGGSIKGDDATHRFIIDPLDGTNNFIHAVPYFCISIALEKTEAGKSEIVAGVIYDPIHNDMFMAEKGRGAFLNERRLAVSRRDNFEEAMLVTGNPRLSDEQGKSGFELLNNMSGCHGCVRYTGATALDLAYIAAGRYDAGWFTRHQPWDIAAGMLLVQEAGGYLTQINGKTASMEAGTLLATNKVLHPGMLNLLAGKARTA